MANAFTITPGGGYDVGGALAGLGQQFKQSRIEDEQRAQQQQMQQLFTGAAQGNAEAMNQLWSAAPEMAQMFEQRNAEKIAKVGAAKAFESKKAETEWGLKWTKATPEQKTQLLQEALANDLIDIDEDDVGIEGPQADLAVNSMLYGHLGKNAYKDLGLGGGVGGDKALPAEAASFNDLIKDFTPEQQKTAKLIKTGLKGRAISNAELSAIANGTIGSYSEYKINQKQAEKFAELTGSSRAKRIDKGFETITKIDGAVRNIDRAIDAIKGGAGVGVLEKMWPSIKAASVELDNIRSSMALDVVGATTFGALSAGELALAKDVALPTGLDTEELLDYLDKRKVAQEKLRNYYSEQIQFLDQGGTVAGFLRMKESEQSSTSGQGNNKDSQALDWANANPNDPRAQAILKKLQGGA